MMTRTIALIGAVLLAAALTVEAQEWSPEVAQSLIYLNSQPGDWVGQGQQLTFTPADGAFTVQGTYNSGVQINFNTPNYSHFWFLDFGPPTAMKFTKGEYEGNSCSLRMERSTAWLSTSNNTARALLQLFTVRCVTTQPCRYRREFL